MKRVFGTGCFALAGVFATTQFALGQTPSTLQLPSTPTATLQAQDSDAINRSVVSPQFRLLSVSPNGETLFTDVEEIKPLEEDSYPAIHTLRPITLGDGAVSTLLRFQSVSGYDWLSGSPGPEASAQTTAPKDKTEKGAPWITLGQPTNAPPPKDVLQALTPGAFAGKIVYVAFVRVSGTGDDSQWRRFLVLRRVGENVNSVQTYPVELKGGDLFLPQWSPDGREVLLKVGNSGDRYNIYLMHFWNPATGELQQGPTDYISHLEPRWSPDSRRVAYAIGGDIAGRIDPFTQLITLRVYDLASQQSATLAKDLRSADFSWVDADHLLYTVPQPAQDNAPTLPGAEPAPPPHPSIHQVSVADGASQLLIPDGLHPVASPDGRWVAFFGWLSGQEARDEIATNPTSAYYGQRLMIFDRTTKRRFLVRPNVFEPGAQVLWTPDSRKLVLLRSSYNAETARGTARISTLAVE